MQVFDIPLPPSQDELPYEDSENMETARHRQQMTLLIDVMQRWLEPFETGYVGGNMFIYFSLAQVCNQDFRGPDFFLVRDSDKSERKSWVVWEEGQGPDVVIELLSEKTATFDKTSKKTIYEQQLRVPEYYWYDPFNAGDFAGFKLDNGVYKTLPKNPQGHIHSPLLNLKLLPWQGVYQSVETTWLRWANADGEILPTVGEAAEKRAAEAEAESTRLRALLAQQPSE